MGQRGDLFAGKPDPVGKVCDVDTPLVLTVAPGTGAVDRDLSVPHRQRQPLAQLVAAPRPHRLGHREVPHERAKEEDGRNAGRHHRLQPYSHVALVRRFHGADSRHGILRCFGFRNICDGSVS